MAPTGRARVALIFALALLLTGRGRAGEPEEPDAAAEARSPPPPPPPPPPSPSPADGAEATEDLAARGTPTPAADGPWSTPEAAPPETPGRPPATEAAGPGPGGANGTGGARPGPRLPRPSRAPPRERKWMLCEREVVAVPYAEPLYVHCGAVDGATGGARLELWFQRVGRFRPADAGDDEGVRNPFPRAPPVLLFAIQNGSVAYRSEELGDRYIFPLPADPRDLPLTVRSLTAATEGVYTWRRDMGAKSQRKTVTVTTYRAPDVSVEPLPTLEGAGYAAACRAAEYYPPRSTRLRWFRNGYPVEARRARETFAAGASGLFSRTSVLALEDAGAGAHPPNLRCEVSWLPSASAERRFFSAAAMPAVYRPPELRVYFEGGEAVCEARCVPEERVALRWTVRDGAAGDAPQRTEQTGVCAERPGLVNLRGARLLSAVDGPIEYTCTATGYPAPLPEFSMTATYDASPGIVGGPVLIGVVAVVCGLGAVGLLLLVALCLRRRARPGL
ncbi:envelope glycoprotein C [Cervid alphaherpesvirus 1]|uniref:Glycoprotein C n=1 Tax=Cervid alphaherpesvirus 1 TaxID=79891 RepID=Q2LDY7_9ALPH|nr:envelope glycoprotein C [Cervid alphaherpesvirus 1]ABC59434.1 glycoprotein C [Cervid alphaherpesvirus 1]AVT50665.1 envelope glycoprotein C [Cervid alphaherpesvirus 1]